MNFNNLVCPRFHKIYLQQLLISRGHCSSWHFSQLSNYGWQFLGKFHSLRNRDSRNGDLTFLGDQGR